MVKIQSIMMLHTLLFGATTLVCAVPSSEYNCVLCMNTIDLMKKQSMNYLDACKQFTFCSFNQEKLLSLPSGDIHASDSRSICQRVDACPMDQIYSSSPVPFDIRVSKGHLINFNLSKHFFNKILIYQHQRDNRLRLKRL